MGPHASPVSLVHLQEVQVPQLGHDELAQLTALGHQGPHHISLVLYRLLMDSQMMPTQGYHLPHHVPALHFLRDPLISLLPLFSRHCHDLDFSSPPDKVMLSSYGNEKSRELHTDTPSSATPWAWLTISFLLTPAWVKVCVCTSPSTVSRMG